MIITNGAPSVGGTLYRVGIGPFTPTADYDRGGYTIIGKYAANAFATGGSGVRIVLRGPATTGHALSISNVTISLASNTTSANAYDSAASPTAVTFGGSASVILQRAGFAYSDNITFSIDRTRDILVAFNIASGSQWISYTVGLNTKYYTHYVHAALAEAGTASRTAGYSGASGLSPIIGELQCYS